VKEVKENQAELRREFAVNSRRRGIAMVLFLNFLYLLNLLIFPMVSYAQVQRVPPGDSDLTLRAMRDEMERSRERLHIPGLERPYFIEYRLLDVDVRTVSASFGAIVASADARNRFMNVDVRVGDYQLDSSNFVTDEGFRGFIGSSGMVGIDRDYDSLRQDLWLASDQAYKEAVERFSRKRGFLRSLARPPDIPDMSRAQPVVLLEPLREPDWTSRDWQAEARAVSKILRAFPHVYDSRVTYYLMQATYYLMTSEGTQVRVTRTAAAIEANLDTQSPDGMRLHHYWTSYAPRPALLPDAAAAQRALEAAAQELAALRTAPTAPDYTGPVLFESEAAGALLAQTLLPSVGGSRPPLSMLPLFDQMMERLGGRSEWIGRTGTRVLPPGVTLVDDPAATEFQGQPLIGGMTVDDEGVNAQRVVLVENGTLRGLLMSRRPGPDLQPSNGHARSAFLGEPRSTMTNLTFQASETVSPAELRAKFLETCRAEGREWCLVVKRMDNPALALQRQEEFSEVIMSVAGGAAAGERMPLSVYRVWVDGGKEEIVRGARLTGLTLRALRNIAAIGNDSAVFNFFQNPSPGFAGTALGAFGGAQGGLPSSIVAPSLLFEEVEVRGARGEPRRLPLLPAPPLN